jgi:hypothetical protein
MSSQENLWQPQEGDLYIQEVTAGHFTIHRYQGGQWEQMQGGFSEQDIQDIQAALARFGFSSSQGHRRYYRQVRDSLTFVNLGEHLTLFDEMSGTLTVFGASGSLKLSGVETYRLLVWLNDNYRDRLHRLYQRTYEKKS